MAPSSPSPHRSPLARLIPVRPGEGPLVLGAAGYFFLLLMSYYLLRPLREEGVLVLGSGDVVHNLSLLDWDMPGGYPWADAFDGYIRDAVVAGRHGDVVHFEGAGPSAARAFARRDHYDPLLYALGATESGEAVRVFNDERVMGALSMSSFIIG